MRTPVGVGITSLLIIGCVTAQPSSQQTTPSQRELRVAPKVLLQLPPNFTALPTKTSGLNEIVVRLPQKQSAYIKVTSEKRRSEEEALRRLLEVAQEGDGKRTFVEICGWPALERQYRVKLAQVMAGRTKEPLPEAPVVQAATIAIAQGDTLIRFDAALQPGATAEGTAPIFALVRTISCRANPNPGGTKPTIEKLKQELSQNPAGTKTPNPLPTVARPLLAASAATRRSEHGALASVQTSTGPIWSEIQITASADSKTVVVGSNGGTSFSNNYGYSFTASAVTAGFNFGDPTLATGASDRFYLSGVSLTNAGCANPVDVDAKGTGSTFAFAGNAAFCPLTGNICTPDQPQIAADTRNSTATGDQLYLVWRHFPRPWWWTGDPQCTQINVGWPTPTISCSSNNGASWGHQTAVGSGDWGRVTVGTDGFVYVAYVVTDVLSGSSVMLNKFSSCANGLSTQTGFPVKVASFSGIDCPISGLDRCDSSATASPQPAVLPDFPKHVFVAYAEKNGNGNDDIVVRHSHDGGLTWPDRTVANTAVTAHRFLPWICGASNGANVSWYDRRAATLADDSLTSYFFNTTLGLGAGTERNISSSADSQKTATTPCCPKYGDYNGNTCTPNRVYVAWASATAPPGVTAPGGINVFVEAIPPGPPMITSVTPAQAKCGSGTTIMIAGANFQNVSGVRLETLTLTVPLSNFTVNSTSLITATVPSNLAAGVYEVVVNTPSGSSVQPSLSARTDQFSVGPTITSLNPSSGPAAGGTRVTVNGSCFEPKTRMFFGAKEGPVLYNYCESSTQCVAFSPAVSAVTSVDVVAKTGGAASSTVPADRFTYVGPQITSISPASGPVTGGTYVIVEGSGFPRWDYVQTLLNTPMAFGSAQTVAQCDSTWCIVYTPVNASPGPVDVVATAFGTSSGLSAADVFTYTAKPRLVRFSTWYVSGPAVVSLDGNAPGGGASVALSSTNQSLVSLPPTVTIPAGQVAAAFPVTINPSPTNEDVTLTASYDGTSLTNTVNVVASPALTLSIDPGAPDAGRPAKVTVGLNSPAPTGGATVTLSSSSPAAISVPATVTIPAGSYSTSFSITISYSAEPLEVTVSATYNGASASDSIIAFIPPPPPPSCPTEQCPAPYSWNSDLCQCELPTIPH